MATLVEVVYPSTTSFTGTSQLNLGPYTVPTVATLLRCECRGRVNFYGESYTDTNVLANILLWGVQWVPTGDPGNDVVTSADGPGWLIREQLGHTQKEINWAPSTDTAASLGTDELDSDWAGQLPVGQSIDLWWSMRAPTGAAPQQLNVYCSLRFWWTAT